MARSDQANPRDVLGDWFVDTRCIDCDVARQWAPELVGIDADGLSYVARQPSSEAEASAMWRAALACPTRSIGNRSVPRPPTDPVPFELTPGVLAMGHNARSSFGAHSYLLPRPEGNVLVDSPRYSRPLAEQVDDLGGIAHILLSHRDDIADANRWADRYGSRAWIHIDDSDAAPWATDRVEGDAPLPVAPGITIVPAPGHTRGSVVVHVDQSWLFTGDSLHWNRQRGTLDVFARQTWHSWDVLAESMALLSHLEVEWVFPGHGMWHRIGPEEYAGQMARLASSMREVSRTDWSRRPDSSPA
ncbi:MAG: MBL fold metallo-hydrolase [Microthrixaceae bacterium]